MAADPLFKSNLAQTSLWTAACRSVENDRQDGLFKDPWAVSLAGDIGAQWLANRTPESFLPIIIRTRFFDNFLLQVVHQRNIHQVVLVAAGLDTRGYRLELPNELYLYEMDQPEVLEYKAKIIGHTIKPQKCNHIPIKVDLASAWENALLDSGFNPRVSSVWLLEGLLFYIENTISNDLLKKISSLACKESWIGLDVINQEVLSSPYTRPWIEMQAKSGAPWIGTMDDPEGLFASLGWKAALTQAGAPDANFGRWTLPVYPVKLPGFPHNWFVTAEKMR